MSSNVSKSSLGFIGRCRQTQSTAISSRNFSTTASCSAIGPENPRFIEIPTTQQPDARGRRDIKGTLPPPRNLFPNRGPNKISKKYLDSVTRQPVSPPNNPNDWVAWKHRLASQRRENLKEALVNLHKRKLTQERIVAHKSYKKRMENEKRLKAPQREDERLMNPTITEAMSKLQVGFVPDPERESELAQKALRVQMKEAEREEQRKNALHTLYMKARSFITTEEQLNAKIDEIFTFPFDRNAPDKRSIWEVSNKPPTVQDMLAGVNNAQKTTVETWKHPAVITGDRMQLIAEELTGGKMDF
ncbi:hypothetical protein SS1G_02534 [Sclerotinia sclerotiorum 1980 UF-70]|uniref:Uncharacterized protein n=2 Tax=Sclerotinia sclerotiorum (strain ATCC 18683 / 1980 / Ss-1) TaxID=665079 RepID=A7EB48_SCLS1|nr:hypothetical protein SS1G_02534 [Sclerotinia sclerotiorum 1980 UF-70]APA08757.1 hypothetical protein sscle_04g035270 [Sclerotinia sclerotiorum 1980 UF-70]EDN99676.1 hypothetical protein SS1G_02534 [Sclerotinia sclerotiorum 1980 UF-70]